MENNEITAIYAVVEFLPKRSDGQKEVDLVPSSWLTWVGEEVYSYYPNPDDYRKLDKYVQELRDAKDTWKKYPVEILSHAENYSQAKRRLKRSFTTSNIKSTDESSRRIAKPFVMSQARVFDEMNKISQIHDDGSSTNFVEKNKSKKNNKQQDDEEISSVTLSTNPELREVIDLESLKEFISAKLNEQTALVQRYLVNEKKSLQYDFKKYVDEIKNTLIANKLATDPQQSASNAIETLDVELPLKNLEEFQNFDAELKNKPSKKEALLTFFRIKIFGEKAAKGCISKMASALF